MRKQNRKISRLEVFSGEFFFHHLTGERKTNSTLQTKSGEKNWRLTTHENSPQKTVFYQ